MAIATSSAAASRISPAADRASRTSRSIRRQHPKSLTRFLRHVQPKAVRLATNIPRPGPGPRTPAVATVTTIDVWRPLIGYPEMVFAGVDAPGVVAQVIANAAAARAAGDAVGVNDPDVTHLRVTVEVRAPAHDTGPATLRGASFASSIPPKSRFRRSIADAVLVPGAALTLTLDYVDVADVAMLVPPAAGAATLPVPRARDVRLRLVPHGADKHDYFGEAWVQTGLRSKWRHAQRRRTKSACSQTKRPNATLTRSCCKAHRT